MSASRFTAVLLSGGLSSRMQRFKPLLPLGGETIVDRVISLFADNGVEVLLVAGHRKDELLAGVKRHDIRVVENPDYEKGMFSSIKAGVRQLKSENQAFFIMPVDIPLVRPSTIKKLMDVSEGNSSKIIYPVFEGRRGHPALLPANLAAAIMRWDKAGGLKSCLLSQPAAALEIQVPDCYILCDIDTRQDYEALLDSYRSYEVPTEEESNVILEDICRVAPSIRRHCLMVSNLAEAIAERLNETGQNVDVRLVRASSMLHDIAKGQPQHAIAAGKILREWGFGKAADIVSVHTDLSEADHDITLEDKIVFLADKLVKGEKPVSIEERFLSSDRLYGSNPEVKEKIWQRRKRALDTKKELEILLGYPLETIINTTIFE
jgi:molybdenum cofactor cytidylyltransferase